MPTYSYEDFIKVRDLAGQEEWSRFAEEIFDLKKNPILLDLCRSVPKINDQTFDISMPYVSSPSRKTTSVSTPVGGSSLEPKKNFFSEGPEGAETAEHSIIEGKLIHKDCSFVKEDANKTVIMDFEAELVDTVTKMKACDSTLSDIQKKIERELAAN